MQSFCKHGACTCRGYLLGVPLEITAGYTRRERRHRPEPLLYLSFVDIRLQALVRYVDPDGRLAITAATITTIVAIITVTLFNLI